MSDDVQILNTARFQKFVGDLWRNIIVIRNLWYLYVKCMTKISEDKSSKRLLYYYKSTLTSLMSYNFFIHMQHMNTHLHVDVYCNRIFYGVSTFH